MGILTGLVPQTEHVKVKERIPEMEPPRLGLELQWFDDFPGPLFFWGSHGFLLLWHILRGSLAQ